MRRTALVIAMALAVSPWLAQAAMTASTEEVIENGAGKFRVGIYGLRSAPSGFQTVEFGDLVIDARQATTGSDWDYAVYTPGEAHLSTVRLSRNADEDQSLYTWWYDASRGADIRHDIQVDLLKRDGSVARSFMLFGASPISWDPADYTPDSPIKTESMVVKYERLEMSSGKA